MKKYISTLALFLCWVVVSQAQPLNRATYASMIKTAEEQMELQDYYQALVWYEKAYDESKDRDLLLVMADLSYELREYRDAERWYSRALKKNKRNPNPPEDRRWNYGQALKINGKYDEALEQFNKFLEYTSDPVEKELTEMEIAGCEFAKIAKEDEQVTITHAGKKVNTKLSEYSPYLTNDNNTVYYASLNGDEVVELEEGEQDKFTKIYKATRGDKGWGEGTALSDEINREGYHAVNPTLSPDGKRLFFNRSETTGNVLSYSKIFMSEQSGSSWAPPNEVAGVNGDYIAKSPAVGELFGKEVLFFASNMEGGEGGYDIYYATYKGNGQYGDPINLGPKINTSGDEDSPFYHNGILYFSSNAHPGLGGFDIFMSNWDGVRWGKPQNMGMPYNSSADDIDFMLDQEGYHGFIASNRIAEGAKSVHGKTCCNDIYNVSLKKIEADLIALAYDKATGDPLNGVTFEFYQVTDGGLKPIDQKTNAGGNNFDAPLELDLSYMIIATAENYGDDTITFNTVGLFDSKTFNEKLELDPERVVEKLRREEPFVLENILYDFNDDKILPAAEPDLEFIQGLMERYPEMVIELSSHTDARGTDAANNDLSQRRADSARRWLIKKGIARARIQTKGYGETVPQTVNTKINEKYTFLPVGQVLTEEYINGLKENEEQFEAAHQINRRTEFKIIEGPTSIVIEEEKLIQIGNRKVDGEEGATPKKEDKKKPSKNKRRRGGNSVIEVPNLQGDPVKVHKMSSLYGKEDLSGLPVMDFKERVFDMGDVKLGEVREYTFHYTNRGDVTLEIDLVQVCECTEKEYSPRKVAPGESGWIKVIFDSKKATEDQDYSDVDIYLKNIDPEIDAPIFERVKYTFNIVE